MDQYTKSRDIKKITIGMIVAGIIIIGLALKVHGADTQYRAQLTPNTRPVLCAKAEWKPDGTYCNGVLAALQRDSGQTDGNNTEIYEGDSFQYLGSPIFTVSYFTAPVYVTPQSTVPIAGIGWYFTSTDGEYIPLSQGDNFLNLKAGHVIPVDYDVPQVVITAPTATSINGLVSFQINATDDVGITKVEVYQDSVLVSTLTTAPYTLSVDTTTLSNSTHTFRALAYDASGKTATATYTTIVNNPDTVPPTTAITFPLNIISGKAYHVTATATDNIAIKKVEFYLNTTFIFSQSVTPFDSTFDTTKFVNGTYSLTTKAYDAAGNVTVSIPVLVIIKN